jgi:DNA ligase D-like protein (predicted ligase)
VAPVTSADFKAGTYAVPDVMRAHSLLTRIHSLPPRSAAFVEPMECLAVSKLPEGSRWVYEIKLDGYRALGIKSNGSVRLLSRRNNSFNRQYPLIVEALAELPEDTIVDGEVVALDASGFPNFNLLQNYRSEAARIHFFVFDLLVCRGRDLTKLPLIERREVMRSMLKFSSGRVRITDYLEASATDMLHAVRQQGLEGIIGKRKDSIYEIGKRSGSWIKYRVNRGQELVIGGYISGAHGLDSIVVGYYTGKDLVYVARVRNGFVPASRRQVFGKLKALEGPDCPFVNLPEKHRSRWGEGLTAEDMKKCVWLRPKLVAQIEFLEWTESDHLRHPKFVGLREDKDARSVNREQVSEP